MGAASSGSGSSAKNITRSPRHDQLETTSDRGSAIVGDLPAVAEASGQRDGTSIGCPRCQCHIGGPH